MHFDSDSYIFIESVMPRKNVGAKPSQTCLLKQFDSFFLPCFADKVKEACAFASYKG